MAGDPHRPGYLGGRCGFVQVGALSAADFGPGDCAAVHPGNRIEERGSVMSEPTKLQDLIDKKVEQMVESATRSYTLEWTERYGGRFVRVKLLGLKSEPGVIRLEWSTNGGKINRARAINLIGQMLVAQGHHNVRQVEGVV